ncbi:hypothetical protein [Prochlorococcus sp. MIT 1201]|uniref:hypothetical protein n=1 Tax=Prochlorococcus sp. MIT 1201 TaxID=3082535 RepID=UPI0039A5A56C
MRPPANTDLLARELSGLLDRSACMQIKLLAVGEIEAGQGHRNEQGQGQSQGNDQGQGQGNEQGHGQSHGQALSRWRGLRR